MPKRNRLFAAIAVVFLLVLGALVLWPRSILITPESYARIQIGMSRPEVEAVVGCPPGFHATGPTEKVSGSSGDYEHDGMDWDFWGGDTIAIFVYFDIRGTVVHKSLVTVKRKSQGFFENLRWQLDQRTRQKLYLSEANERHHRQIEYEAAN